MTSIRVRGTAVLSGSVAALALGALASMASAATPAKIQLDSVNQRSQTVTITTTTSGRTLTQGVGQFIGHVTPTGGAPVTVNGFCDEPLVAITIGQSYDMQLQSGADDPALVGANYQAAEYIIRTSAARVAAAANPGLESGAGQIAVWQLGGRVVMTNPTTSPEMNARAAELRAEGLAAAASVQTPGATSGAATCAGSGTVLVNVAGDPGATAQVSVPSGAATVNVSRVVLDSTGHGTVRVASSAAGQSVVRVVLDTGNLVRAARTSAKGPQQTVLILPSTTEFNVPVTFTDCTTPTTPTTPNTPASAGDSTAVPVAAPKDDAATTVPATPGRTPLILPSLEDAGLKLVKTGPKQIGLGRAITFRLVVTNTGTSTLTDVRVTDPVPEGAYVPKNSATAKRLNGGAVVFTVPSLAPGKKRTFTVQLRALANRTGTICNVADASGVHGSGSTSTTLHSQSTACTKLKGKPAPRIAPAVTG